MEYAIDGGEKREFYDATPAQYFDDAGIPSKIEFDANAKVTETLKFKYYNANEMVCGRKMRDWLRFSVVYWHTFRGTGFDPFGHPTLKRPWENKIDTIENAKRRLDVAFEFFKRLGNDYYAFHDRDLAPEGANLAETNQILDQVTDHAMELQRKTGVKLLWATCNLFANARFMNGAATNPDAHVFAYAGAQVKKGLEVGKKLDAEGFVFWGGREGFHCLFNTNLRQELDNMAKFFKMVVDYKQKIHFTGQLYIEPKPKEPTKHQYDYDVMTVIGFLKTYGLYEHFKINVEPNHTMLAGHDYLHDVAMASAYQMLGSIDANAGSPDLGWDTDQFPMDPKQCAWLMKIILENGGLAPGGLNFDCKVRRESINIRDMFIAHIGAMDALARGLRIADKMLNDRILTGMIKERYLSFETSDIGKMITAGNATLEDCDAFIRANGEPKAISGQQEHWESVINRYL